MAAWIKKNKEAEVTQELEYTTTGFTKTDAYECEVTDAYLQKGKDSESLSLCIGVKSEDGETAKTFFTILGRDGETYYTSTVGNKTVKKQHIGLSIVNSLFKIVLCKEIFDLEPSEITYKQFNKDSKEMENVEGDGFPELIGKNIGVCIQMVRTIDGANSKETSEIAHFFDIETGLFADEEQSEKTKLTKWLATCKEFKEKIVEKKESSFGKKQSDKKDEEAPKSKWGKR